MAYSLVAIDIEDVPDNYPVFEKAVWVKECQTIKETFFSVIFFLFTNSSTNHCYASYFTNTR